MANRQIILPDTNYLILGLADHPPYSSHLREWINNNQIILSVIVVAEFLVGATATETTVFHQLIQTFPTLPIDLETAQLAAKIRQTHLKNKTKLHLPDCLIAAQCQLHKCTLATLNPKDYPPTLSKI